MALTKITSSLISNNTISVTNIADNAIDATKIASNSILTRHIDDDQITGDQLADAITVVTSVTTPLVDAAILDGENFKINGGQGTDGQVLTSTGSGVAWEATSVADGAITSAKLDTNIAVGGTLTVTGDITGTLATVAQPNITSLGTIASLVATTADINGGTVDGTVIGGTTAAAISGTTGTFGNTGAGTYVMSLSNNDQGNARFRFDNSGTGGGAFSLVAGTPGANNAGFAIYDEDASATRLLINSSGNVGIGTTNPSQLLHLGGATNKGIQITSSTSNAGYLAVYQDQAIFSINRDGADGSFADTGKAAAVIKIHSASADSKIELQTTTSNNAEPTTRMTIDSSGNVGIGTSPNTTIGKLDVAGSATNYATAPMMTFKDTAGSTNSRNWSIGGVAINYGDFHIGCGDTNSDYFDGTTHSKFMISKDGNVGIGTTNPTSPLQIASFSANADNTDTDTHAKIEVAASGSSTATYKRDCFVQQATGNTQYHWYKIFIGGSQYGRGVNIKYTANWSTEHASGQGFVDGSFMVRSEHATSQCGVYSHVVYSRSYIGGSYYAWSDNPDITLYASSASGTSGGLLMRVSGYRASGFDGGTVHSIYLEIFGSRANISNQGIYYIGSSTPADIGAVVSRTLLS